MIHESTKQFEKAMTFAGIADCPQDGHWQIPTDSDICTEIETIALVFGFVRMLRPKLVVETGCNVGCMTQAILQALIANSGEGLLITCDVDAGLVRKAYVRCGGTIPQDAERSRRLMHFSMAGLWVVEHYPDADLYFIDSSEESRGQELAFLREHGKKGAVVLVHDTSCYEYLNKMVREFPQHVILPGPRGLGIITL